MPSMTFAIAAGADDCYTGPGDTVYPPLTAPGVDATSPYAYAARDLSGTSYRVWNLLLRWDTSALPDAATVTGATLRVYTFDQNASWGQPLIADWINWTVALDAYTENPPSNANSGYTYTTGSPNVDADITLANAAANVSKTGMTGLRLNIKQATGDAAPTDFNYFGVRTYENTPTTPAPRLIVDYTLNTARLAPDAIISQSNLTGAVSAIQDDPDAADANWLLAP